MSDSDTTAVENDLDAFSEEFFNPKPVESEVVTNEASEPTPSATENESEAEGDEPEAVEPGDDAAAEPDDEVEEEEVEQPKPQKKRRNAQERIDELTREKYELQRQLEAVRQERREPEAKPEKQETKPFTLPSDAPQFDALNEDGTLKYPLGEFDPNFIYDLTQYTIDTKMAETEKKREQARQQEAMEASQRELVESWQQKVEEAAIPDLDQKFEGLRETFSEIPADYGDFLASSIMTLDNGPDVLNYFAENVEEAAAVIAKGPLHATLVLGRLDAKFAAEKAKSEVETERVKTTQAPPPPPRTKGSAAVKTIRQDTDNLDDFEKLFYQK